MNLDDIMKLAGEGEAAQPQGLPAPAAAPLSAYDRVLQAAGEVGQPAPSAPAAPAPQMRTWNSKTGWLSNAPGKPEPVTEEDSQFTKGLIAGGIQLKQLGVGAAAVAGDLVGADQFASEMAKKYMEYEGELKPYTGRVDDVTKINTFNDFLDWSTYMAGNQIPNILSIIATGGVTGAIGKMVAKGIITQEVAALAAAQAAKIATRSAMGGAAAASGVLGVGEVGGEQISTTGEVTDPTLALGAGAAIGALDMLAPVALLHKLGFSTSPLTRQLSEKLLGKAADPGFMARVLRGAAGGMVGEGLTEELQEEIAIAAREVIDEGYDPTGSEADSRRLNALAGGMLMGGMFGGVGGALPSPKVTDLDFEKVRRDLAEDDIAGIPDPDVSDPAILQSYLDDLREREAAIVAVPGSTKTSPVIDPYKQVLGGAMRADDTKAAASQLAVRVGSDGVAASPENTRNWEDAKHQVGTAEIIGFEGVSDRSVRNLKKTLDSWLQAFAPEQRIILSDGSIYEKFENKQDVSFLGWSLSLNASSDIRVIELNKNLLDLQQLLDEKGGMHQKAELMRILTHEFGHAIVEYQYRRTSEDIKIALHREYREWLKRFENDTSYGRIMKEISGVASAREYGEQTFTPSQEKLNYYLSFVEYIANQTARHLVNTPEGLDLISSASTGFFRNIARVLRRYYQAVKMSLPAQTGFTQFLEHIVASSAVGRAVANQVRARGRPSPFTENTAPSVVDPEGLLAAYNGALFAPYFYARADGKIASTLGWPRAGEMLMNDLFTDARTAEDTHVTLDNLTFALDATTISVRKDQQTGRFNWAGIEPSLKDIVGLRMTKEAYEKFKTSSLVKDLRELNFDMKDDGVHVTFTRPDMAVPAKVSATFNAATAEVQGMLDRVQNAVGATAAEKATASTGKDFYGKGVKYLATIIQLLKKNRHIPGVTQYMEALYAWSATRMRMITRADDRIKSWTKLGKEQGHRLGQLLFEMNNLGYWPDEAQMVALLQKHKLSQEAYDLFKEIQADFREVLNTMEQVMISEASKIGDLTQRSIRVQAVRKEFSNMRLRPYFPLSRFGQYTIVVRSNEPITHEGRLFKQGEVIRFEAFESKSDRDARMKKIMGDFTGKSVVAHADYIPESAQQFRGLPPNFLAMLVDKLSLTDEQKKGIQLLMYEQAPAQSFRHHFQKRANVPGYSMDAMRSYGNYFFHAANNIARIQHHDDFMGAMDTLKENMKDLGERFHGIDLTKRRQIQEHLEHHFQYVMNPQNEWAQLRSVAFHWYLGFMVRSAVVNLTQVPIATYSHLAALYSDAGAIKEIARSYARLRQSLGKNHMDVPEHIMKVRALGHEQGFLDESQATELAAVSEGSMLQRAIAGTPIQRVIRGAGYYGSWLFHHAEKINRAVTFDAAYNLALANPTSKHMTQIRQDFGDTITQMVEEMGLTIDQAAAFIHARDVVTTTQGEYARFNRPSVMRGKRGVIFVFKMFMQHMLWLARYEPGGKRYLLIMLGLAGLSGAPFADDAMDIAKWLARLFGGNLDVRREVREFVNALGANPDLIMHGIARDSFGMSQVAEMFGVPFPRVDLSGSLSMGRVIPGVEGLTEMMTPGEDFGRGMSEATSDILGAGMNIVTGVFQAIGDPTPNNFKRFERALPVAMRSISRSYRYMSEGREKTRGGATIAKFSMTDPQQAAEAAATALGFTPTRVAQKWEQVMAQRDAAKYFQIRRKMLLDGLDEARQMKDREAYADIKGDIRRYNKEVPPPLRLSGSDIAQSGRSRAKNRRVLERGQAPQRMYRRLYKEVEEDYPVEE